MAQFNSLLVTGESRFINPINGNARNGVYTVIGTQTASTSAWTGKIDVPALYDGLKIAYYLPYASTSSNVTLNLTLSTGATTGAVNCYYDATVRIDEQFKVSNILIMTYYSAGSISISGTATTDNRWIAEKGTDENVYQEEVTSGSNRRVVLGGVFAYGSGTSKVYTNPNFYFSPGTETLTLQYDNSIDSPKIELNANHTNFYNSWVEFSDEIVDLTASSILLDSDSFIGGEGNIDIDGDITCTGALSADTLNGETIGSSPKFTDTIGQIYYCETDSTSTTSAFVVSVTGITALTDGLTLCIKNTKGTSASGCTLNLNGLGAKTIWLSLDNAACTTEWKVNSIYIFVYDATNQRWVMNMGRDTDVTGNNIIARYSRLPSGGNNVKKYSLFAMLPSGVYSSFTTNSGTGNKTFDSTNYFDIRKIYAYSASTDRSTGDLLSASGWKLQGYDIDMRYSFNGVTTKASTSSLTQDLPVYMVFDPSAESGGCYKLKSPYYTQTPNATGTIYVLVGVMRDSYRLDFWFYNPAFTYDGTKLVPFANSTLSGLVDTSITNPSAGDILTYDGFNWYNTNTIALKDINRHTTITLDGDTGLITSENAPSSGGQIVTDVAIGGFTTGSGQWFKFSLPFSNTATSAAIISLDQASSKLMLPSAVLQTNFIDLSNSVVSSITKDWITFEFKLNSTQAANAPGTILLVDFEFELY